MQEQIAPAQVKQCLAVAVDYVLGLGIAAVWDRIQVLGQLLRQELSCVKGVKMLDKGKNLCGIVSFTLVRTQSILISTVQLMLLTNTTSTCSCHIDQVTVGF